MPEQVLADKGHGVCGCGAVADKTSSGSPECWPCWNWRKLDGPAARHWERVTTEFLSNVDMYDLSQFLPACGLSTEEIKAMFTTTTRLLEACRAGIEAKRMPTRDLDERVPGGSS